MDVGDYSCACILPDGSELDFSKYIVIERKMNLDELCQCFGRERARFEREFGRAADAGIRIYLLVEGGTWEKVYNGKYRRLFAPQALDGQALTLSEQDMVCSLIFVRLRQRAG